MCVCFIRQDFQPQRSVTVFSAETLKQGNDGLADQTALSKQFCQWFFQLWNSQNPLAGLPAQDWGPQHFWNDAKLLLVSVVEIHQREEFLGAELVSQRLFALMAHEHLIFCPNLEREGLKCLTSPHGLVLVAVAGTIHRKSTCLGIFEQVFGLIRDPLEENRWKIQFVHLKIKGQLDKEMLPVVTHDLNEMLQLFT